MKVLQVNCVYPTGSTGKIVHEIHKGLLGSGQQSVVCYGRGASCNEQGVCKISGDVYAKMNNLMSRVSGYAYGGCRYSTGKLIGMIKKERPDIVHLHCINNHFVNIYRLVRWLNENKIKTVVTNHAEFFYTANCGHAYECDKWMTGCGHCPNLKKATKSLLFDKTAKSFEKMRYAFDGFGENVMITSVSPWVEQRASRSPIFAELPHCTILNAVDTETFKPWTDADIYQECRQKGEKVVFHATAHFTDEPGHTKGGWAIIELAKRMQDSPVKFYVAAGRQDVKTALPENIVLLGNVKDQTLLAKYYAMADLSLITSKRETFSMPCAESLCCGTPVVGFEAGAPEMISIESYSQFVPYGDMDSLEQTVREWLDREDLDRAETATQAMERYSNEKMVQAFLNIYGELL